MIRVTPRQLEEVRRVYPNVKTVSTKHHLYITNIQLNNEPAYMRCMAGRPSNRQQDHAETNKRRQERQNSGYSGFYYTRQH